MTHKLIVAAGRELVEAKAALGHGRFEQMVTDDLGMDDRVARMFMAVARHGVLGNRSHDSALPPSYNTLYQLSRLPAADLTAAIDAHEVRPDMERREAQQLAGRHHSQRRRRPPGHGRQQRVPGPAGLTPPAPADLP